MMLQQRSDAPPLLPYTDVSVLLLSWENDSAVDTEAISSLQHTLQSDYKYNTTSWQIPAVSNPSIKLGVQMASFLEHARPNHLLIIYYAGRAYLGCDDHIYWAEYVSPPLLSYQTTHRAHCHLVTLGMTLQGSAGMAYAACLKMPSQISCYFLTPALLPSLFPRVTAVASSKSFPRIYRIQPCPAFRRLPVSLLAP